MSFSTRGTCPHGRGVFIWLADGPWLDNPTDPDHGNYPWVHDTSISPGHLEVCDQKPFATPEEAGELCVCGHPSHEHFWNPSPIGHEYKPVPCPCGCPDFRHRAEDIEARRTRGRCEGTPPAEVSTPAVPVSVPKVIEPEQLSLFGGAA